jgi:hydroxymethylpyrimidine/phosphomethylpyrimidine kinase
MNIRYLNDIVKACEDLGMTIATFDRADEPEEVRTMEWGIAQAIELFVAKDKKVPEVIYDRGGLGKEAMVRVFGSLATHVAAKVMKISATMENEQRAKYLKLKDSSSER